MKNKLDVFVLASGLMAVAVLATAWLIVAIRPYHATAAVMEVVHAPPAPVLHEVSAVAATPAPVATAVTPSYKDAKASFKVIYATWGGMEGARHHSVDVSDHVMDLLAHRGWLKVNTNEMGADPWPGRPKHLYIKYEVLGKMTDFGEKEHMGITLHQLIMAAQVLPAGKADPQPPTDPGNDDAPKSEAAATPES